MNPQQDGGCRELHHDGGDAARVIIREVSLPPSRGDANEMLLPSKAEVARHLKFYRAWERRLLTTPTDRQARKYFEDAAYTLCVLLGHRCGREAADAAETYLRPYAAQYRAAPQTAAVMARPAHHAA